MDFDGEQYSFVSYPIGDYAGDTSLQLDWSECSDLNHWQNNANLPGALEALKADLREAEKVREPINVLISEMYIDMCGLSM